MREYFGCGFIRPDRSDRTIKYEVRSLPELTQKILPHFESHPMLSKKQDDFIKFAEICRKMSIKAHLTEEGFREIAKISEDMNASGKKRYLRNGFKV